MAGNVIKQFFVGLGYDVDTAGQKGFTDGIGKAGLAVAGLGAATFAAAGAITAFVTSVAKELDVISDLSKRTEVAASVIEEMGYIASLTDSSVGAVNATIDMLSRTIGEAAAGLGRGMTTFKALGMEAKHSNGDLKTTAEVMEEVKEKIKDLGRGEQLAVLQKLGIDPTMIYMMTNNVSDLSAEFKALYAGVGYDSEKAAQTSSDFMDVQFKLKKVFDVLKKSLAVEFMPQLMRSMEAIRKTMLENMPRIIAVLKPIMGGVLKLAGILFRLGKRAADVLSDIIEWLDKASGATNIWIVAIGGVMAAWKLLNLSFLLSPIGAILALSAALLLLYDDYMTFKEGGESLIDWGNWTQEIDVAIEALKLWWSALDTFYSAILNFFIAFHAALGGETGIAVETLSEMFDKIKVFLDRLLGFFGITFDGIGEIVTNTVGKIIGLFEKLMSFKGIKGLLDSIFGEGGSGSRVIRANKMPDIPAAAGANNSGATVNQNITNQIQTSDPEAAGRAVERESKRGISDLARNTQAVAM